MAARKIVVLLVRVRIPLATPIGRQYETGVVSYNLIERLKLWRSFLVNGSFSSIVWLGKGSPLVISVTKSTYLDLSLEDRRYYV